MPKPNLETRTFSLETRAKEDGTMTIEGHPAIFNSLSVDLGGFKERIMPGAFQGTLSRTPDVVFLVNHEGLPLARTTSGTLELRESQTGLQMFGLVDLNDPDVQRIIPKMKRGDLTQGSFAFRVLKDEWSINANNETIRDLIEIELEGGDVSLVTQPAYRETDVSLAKRSLEQWQAQQVQSDYQTDLDLRSKTLDLLARA